MKKFFKKIWDIFINVNYFVYTRLPPLIVYVVGYFFVVKIFINFNEDTTSINTAQILLLFHR